jgi:hypothetical protein
VELRVPATERRDVDQQVELGLYLVGERARPDEAELEREFLVLLGVGVLHQADATIRPARIGPIMRVGIDQSAVLGRVDVLPEGEIIALDHAGLAAAAEDRQTRREPVEGRLPGGIVYIAAGGREPDAVRVMPVAVVRRPEIVLLDDVAGPGVVGAGARRRRGQHARCYGDGNEGAHERPR